MIANQLALIMCIMLSEVVKIWNSDYLGSNPELAIP